DAALRPRGLVHGPRPDGRLLPLQVLHAVRDLSARLDHVPRVQRTGGLVQAQRRLRRQGRADPRPGSPWRLPAAAVRGLGGGVNVTAVANYGAAAKAWWWSGFAGATGAQVADVLNGKAWPAGGFKQDNVKKRLVAIERSRVDGRFRFVLNEAKP